MFIDSFVKEILVSIGNAVMHYSIPVRDDSRLSGKNAKELVLQGIVLPTAKNGGSEGIIIHG